MVTAAKIIGVLTTLTIVWPSSVLCQTCNASASTCPSTPCPPCTAAGRIADPSNCKNYITCFANDCGGFSQTAFTCPGESTFDPSSLKCSLNSACNRPTTTMPTTTTKPSFVCPTATGKFADPENCTKYFMCSASVAYSYVCPGTSLFDPTTSKCSQLYVCPL